MSEFIRFPRRRARRHQKSGPKRRRVSGTTLLSIAAMAVTGALGWFAPDLKPRVAAVFGDFPLCRAAAVAQSNCVIDGDTIHYRGQAIRLADIDTPEVFEPSCAAEARRGRRATERLWELVNAGPFEIVRVGGRDRDRYGRKLRLLVRNGRSLGDILVAENLARRWDGARRSWCG